MTRKRGTRHCERSEAIHCAEQRMDCFVAVLLAMTSDQHLAGSPTISGCRASETAGDIRITSACAPKIASAR